MEKILIVRIATPNNKSNSYPPHKRTVTAIEKPYKTAYKNIKNLTVRITTLNNDTNLTPPHGVSFLTDEPVQGGYKNHLPTQKLWNTRSTTVSLTLSPVSSKMQEIASSRETVTAS